MGGRGSGGFRVGSGRKSKKSKRDHRRTAGHDTLTDPLEVLPPPASLSPAEQAIWIALAPHATTAGTLGPETAVDFGVLASLAVEAAELLQARRAAGQSDQGLKLATAYRQTVLRLEAKMRGFKLSPVGKPINPPVAPADPFEEFYAMPALGPPPRTS